jgi:hypothetical protein
MTDPPKRIFLGSVSVPDGESVAFSIPESFTPEQIAERLRLVEEATQAAAVAETARLRQIFLTGGDDEKNGEKNNG